MLLVKYNALSAQTSIHAPAAQLDSISMEHHVYLGAEKANMPKLELQLTQPSASLVLQTV